MVKLNKTHLQVLLRTMSADEVIDIYTAIGFNPASVRVVLRAVQEKRSHRQHR